MSGFVDYLRMAMGWWSSAPFTPYPGGIVCFQDEATSRAGFFDETTAMASFSDEGTASASFANESAEVC